MTITITSHANGWTVTSIGENGWERKRLVYEMESISDLKHDLLDAIDEMAKEISKGNG